MSQKLREFRVNLGGHDVVITGGTIEDLDTDTLAGALWVEDNQNIAIFDELAHTEDGEDGKVTVTYGVNGVRTETPVAPKKAASEAKTPKKKK